ncbi:MAG: MotA/TolQ/ExbB proton channel family protein [Oscillospiraceae bacterium]|nr:MotA/TolQ/ExbB proton channel family protein [Oscillospiraceae bacterium]
MNILGIIGVIIAFAAVLFGYIADEGVLSSLVKIPAISIVFGGSIGVALIANPVSKLKIVPGAMKLAFFTKKKNVGELIELMVQTAIIARQSGLLALETEAEKYDNPVLKKGMSFIADGVSPEYLKQTLEAECEAGASVFKQMGGAAPTLGVLGTVMGMVSILRDMSDMDSLGGKIATAFIATMYGVGSANLLWLPFAAQIKANAEEEYHYYQIMVAGFLAIQAGDYPTRIKEFLIAKCGSGNVKLDGADTDGAAKGKSPKVKNKG